MTRKVIVREPAFLFPIVSGIAPEMTGHKAQSSINQNRL